MLIRILSYFLFFLLLVVCQISCIDSSKPDTSLAIQDTASLMNVIDTQISLLQTDGTYAALEQNVPKSLFVTRITLECDSKIDEQEISDLLQLKNDSHITHEHLKNSCSNLARKNKFESIRFVFLREPNASRYALTIHLHSRWTFTKVSCVGPLVAKEKYEQSYGIAYADVFDLIKHEYGLKKIREALKNDGYLKATLHDYIIYDKEKKSVSVHITIDNAERFTISSATCTIIISESCDTDHAENKVALEEKISKKFLSPLKKTYSVKTDITAQIKEIKEYLICKGYIKPKATLKTTLNAENNSVAIHVDIMLAKKQRCVFLGNHFFLSKELLKELLITEGSALLIPPSLLVEDLIHLYQKKGFREVSVSYKEERGTCYFIINEGPRSTISSVAVKEYLGGPSSIEAEKIQKLFSPVLLTLFDETAIANCITKLTQEYYKQGFWHAYVASQDYVQEKNEHTYALEIMVYPGARRMLKKVIVQGHEYLNTDADFNRLAGIGEQVPFNLNIIAKQRAWLVAYFKSKGLAYGTIDPVIEQTSDGDILTWQCAPTVKTYFGKTIVQGDNNLKSKIMLRELAYAEGDEFDKAKVQESINRLKRLGVFKSLSLVPDTQQPIPGSPEEHTKTMILKCIEDSPFEIRTRFGLQQISKNFTYTPLTTFKIGGSILWKNPTGRADVLGFDADITRYSRNTSIQYTLPWLSNFAVSTQYKLFSDAFEQPLLGRASNRLYKATYDGFSIKCSHQSPQVQTDILAAVQAIKLSGLSSDLARLIKFEPSLVDVRNPYLVVEPSVIIDKLDNKVDAKYGSFTALSCKGMFSLSFKASSFLRLLAEQSFFYPLYSDWVIGALRLRVGHIFSSNFTALLPPERFYLGGSNSLRGYEPAMAPPLNACSFHAGSDNHETFWVPVGGKSMVNINAEVRFPIYSALSGVVFNDMGVLSQEGFTALPGNKLLGATGLGLRLGTPIGPIRFDVGWKWHKRDEADRRYAWFLTFGHAF